MRRRPTTTTGSATQVQREDIQSRPRGDSASVNEILATQPGFVYDALGQIYVRGNHANIQYQLDGVPLPDTVSGLFGQFLSARLLENMEVITGGLPAEYGQRLSAVVNLNSRRPAPEGEGRLDLLYGSFETVSPGGYWGQKLGSVTYLLGGSLGWTDRGLDPPNPTTYLNDKAQQGRAFAKVDVDLNDHDHLSTLIGAAWAFTPDLVAHAFFGLLWIPPSVTDAAAGARLTPGAVQPGQPIPYDLRPEKDRYAEVGLKARVVRALTLGLTLWGRLSTDQLDETEIGNTGITTPYNFSEGRAGGIEATVDWVITQRLTAFGNVGFGTAQGKGIATAQYLFDPAALQNQDWQTLDHSQTWTTNAGANYRDGPTLVTVLLAYGSGLRTGADNASHVPGWVRVDLTLAHDFLNLPLRPTLAIDVVNLFDAQYAYRRYNASTGATGRRAGACTSGDRSNF